MEAVHGRHTIMEQLDSLQIHLWLVFPDEITDPRLLREHRLLLSDEELWQQARFRFERDRHRYLVTRAMVRTVLSKYAGVAPQEWRFETSEFVKPRVANDDAWARRISFNVAHTSGLVLLGVTLDRALGVDVEATNADRACVDIADRFFAPAEVRALRALSREQQVRRFYEYWTLKESYIKARGLGLSIPLDRFAFHLDAAGLRLTVDPTLDDRAERWTFWRLQIAREHLAAVCAERGGAEQLHLSLHCA